MENLRAIEKSTCVSPNPEISFRPSVPCLGVEGIENALTLSIFLPGAFGALIHSGCPGRRSGRMRALPKADGPKSTALNGNPVRATITVLTDQFLVRTARSPYFAAVGTS